MGTGFGVLVALLASTAAVAGPPAPMPDAAHITSADWALADGGWWVDAPVVFSQRTGDLRLRSGYVFRIDDASGPVGAAFVADGTLDVHFEDAREARRFATRRVLSEGDDPASLAEVARGASWRTEVDRGALLGVDVWTTLSPSLVAVVAEGGVLLARRAGGIEEVLVVNHGVSLPAARRAAEALLEQRTRRLRDNAYDPAAWVAMDRMEGCRQGSEGAPRCNRLADVRTQVTWDRYAGVEFLGASGRWLGWVRDPRGLLDPRSEEQVRALAVDSLGAPQSRTVATAAFPLDPLGVATAPHRVDLHSARVEHALAIEDAVRLTQDSVAELTVRAVGGDARVVVVEVPHREQKSYMRMHPLVNGWSLQGVELDDGTPLRHTHVSLTQDQRDGRGRFRTLLVELPEPLAPEQLATVRVRYRDHHRYAHYWELERMLGFEIKSMGVGGVLRASPNVRGHSGAPVPAVVRASLPRSQRGASVAIGGGHRRDWTDGERRFTEVHTRNGEGAGIAVGHWSMHHEPAGPDWPAVTTALQVGHRNAVQLSALVRQAFVFHESLLHPLGTGHITIAELSSTGTTGTRMGSAQDLVIWSPSFNQSKNNPLLLASAFSIVFGVHNQWWLATGAHGVEPSLPTQMSAAYAMMFLSRTSRTREFEKLLDQAREIVTAEGLSALSEDGALSVGAFVLGWSLREAVGDEAFFQGVHEVLLGNAPPTWSGLQLALEQTSGLDLASWFDVWIHGDHAPSVTLTWAQRGDHLHAELTTDLPFGGFRVPVQIDDTLHQVELVDGRGSLTVPITRTMRQTQVAIDPDETLLLQRKRVARRR